MVKVRLLWPNLFEFKKHQDFEEAVVYIFIASNCHTTYSPKFDEQTFKYTSKACYHLLLRKMQYL